jgi:uncharacterized iron-regulated protein
MVLLLPVLAFAADAEHFSIPNGGSPYVNPTALADNEIVHIPTGVKVTASQMLDAVAGARVVYVGETHDNTESHRVQLEIIRGLQERSPGKVAVGMEMFRLSAQPDLDQWRQNNLSPTQFRRLFQHNWGGGYDLYRPIFDFLKEKQIPLFGLKPALETENKLRQEGAKSPQLPEMDTEDVYHKAQSLAVFGGHGSHAEMTKPYEMLVLWEEGMAQGVAEFLQNPAHRDWKLVVLAGGYHVQYGFGVPKRAFRRAPHAYAIVLPTITEMPEELKESREMDVEPVAIPLYSADFAWKVPYTVLAVNKIRLGVLLEETDHGLLIKSVTPKGSAASAGILKDDVLLALDGDSIVEIDDLIARLQKKNFGDTVRLRYRRQLQEREAAVLLLTPNPQ